MSNLSYVGVLHLTQTKLSGLRWGKMKTVHRQERKREKRERKKGRKKRKKRKKKGRRGRVGLHSNKVGSSPTWDILV